MNEQLPRRELAAALPAQRLLTNVLVFWRADPGRPWPGRAVDVPHAGGHQHCAEGTEEHCGHPSPSFVVDDVLDRLRARSAEFVGEAAQYGDIYRYCFVSGSDGIIIGLVEEFP